MFNEGRAFSRPHKGFLIAMLKLDNKNAKQKLASWYYLRLLSIYFLFRYDVANLNCLLGIPESSFTHTVSKNCRAAVVHGFVRKTAKGAIYVQKIDKSEALENEKTQTNDTEISITEHQKETVVAKEKTKLSVTMTSSDDKDMDAQTPATACEDDAGDQTIPFITSIQQKKTDKFQATFIGSNKKKRAKADVNESIAVEMKKKKLKNKTKLAKKRKILSLENEPASKKALAE